MSSLRELTQKVHAEAEKTPIMRLIFAKAIEKEEYQAYAANMCLIYTALEPVAKKAGVFDNLPGLERLPFIRKDIAALDAMVGAPAKLTYEALDYYKYLSNLTDVKKINAHVYVRYAGDLYGGQMLKTLVPGPGHWYDFQGHEIALRPKVREKFNLETVDNDEVFIAYKHTAQIIHAITEFNYDAFYPPGKENTGLRSARYL